MCEGDVHVHVHDSPYCFLHLYLQITTFCHLTRGNERVLFGLYACVTLAFWSQFLIDLWLDGKF